MEAMTRRQFGLACAVGIAGAAAAQAQPQPVWTVRLPDGSQAPALGMGSWHLGQGRRPAAQEEEALRTGLSLGMTLIDTAEIYGGGSAEKLVGRVIAGQRDRVFLVSKVHPTHATSAAGIRRSCADSLARLGTDHLDLYLLHWRGAARDLRPVVDTFEALRAERRIRHWGVSNFGVADMDELHAAGGAACATNQVRYSLAARGIEAGLVPWSEQHRMPLMAYSPLGTGSSRLLRDPALAKVATRKGVTPAAVAIAWTMRNRHTISIPESGAVAHIRENAAAMNLALDPRDLADLDAAFPA